MRGIEVEYCIGEIEGFKCCCCGRHLGSIHNNEEHSDTGFEDWNFCPYCGVELGQ